MSVIIRPASVSASTVLRVKTVPSVSSAIIDSQIAVAAIAMHQELSGNHVG